MSAYQATIEMIRSDFRNNIFENSLEFNSMIRILDRQKLISYLGLNSKEGFPPAIRDVLDGQRKIFQDKAKLFHDFLELINSADKKNVSDYLIIKGMGFNHWIYDDNPIRLPGDIDILVKPEKCMAFHQLLLLNGYRQYKGMTSLSAKDDIQTAVYLAKALNEGSYFQQSAEPYKTRLRDCEYSPYYADEKAVIEMHEGIHFLPEEAICDFFEESTICVVADVCYPTLSLENVFILLVATAYQNSESIASNLFDFGSILRDYVDIKVFFDKYHSAGIWDTVRRKILKYNLNEIAGVVLHNLYEIYGKDVTYDCLTDIPLKESIWRMSILDRLQDPEQTKKNTLKIKRKKWRVDCAKHLYQIDCADHIMNKKDPGVSCGLKTQCKVCFDSIGLQIRWHIPDNLYQQQDEYLYQCRFYPLAEEVPYTQFKLDIGFYDGFECRSYGRRTMRLREEAVKKTGERYNLRMEEEKGFRIIEAQIPFEDLRITLDDLNGKVVFSAHVYQKYVEDIFVCTNNGKEIRYLLTSCER